MVDKFHRRPHVSRSVILFRYKLRALLLSPSNVAIGSEAVEAGIKIAVQYHTKEKPNPQPERKLFIARHRSYHGATLGALDLSGHEARKKLYTKILPGNVHFIPECHEYRNKTDGQSIAEYVQWHKEKLIEMIEELGDNRVAGFIVEPVVGAVSSKSLCSF